MDDYKKILIQKGIKPTFQRIKILEYLDKNRCHATIDMIYEALYNNVPTLSKTTVYSTLDLFDKHSIVGAITITGSEVRYEYNIGPHHHFFCKRCGKHIDLDMKCPYLTKMKTGEHKIEEIHGYFKGICKQCLEEEKE